MSGAKSSLGHLFASPARLHFAFPTLIGGLMCLTSFVSGYVFLPLQSTPMLSLEDSRCSIHDGHKGLDLCVVLLCMPSQRWAYKVLPNSMCSLNTRERQLLMVVWNQLCDVGCKKPAGFSKMGVIFGKDAKFPKMSKRERERDPWSVISLSFLRR